MAVPAVIRRNHAVRSAALAYGFVVLAAHLWPLAPSAWLWAAAALQFLVYPQLLHLLVVRAADPRSADLAGLFLDAALLGAWSALLGFPLWIAFAFVSCNLLGAAVKRGLAGAALAAVCALTGAGVTAALVAVPFAPDTSPLVTALCALGVVGYAAAVGAMLYRQNRHLAGARLEIGAAEERYRRIAEQAGDLVALVDHDSRWLWASPSYQRVLDSEDLRPGTDCWARLHPDDAEQARIAVLRAAASRKSCRLAARLVDREGRVREYRARVQPLGDDDPPMLLVVAYDETPIGEREERLVLAAHALEGLTEAIMITAADGTVVSVNRAYTDITGYTRDEVLGESERKFRQALQPPEFYDELYAIVSREGFWSGTTWSRRKNGSVYREWRSVRAVREAGRAVSHYVSVFYELAGARESAPEAPDAAAQPL